MQGLELGIAAWKKHIRFPMLNGSFASFTVCYSFTYGPELPGPPFLADFISTSVNQYWSKVYGEKYKSIFTSKISMVL